MVSTHNQRIMFIRENCVLGYHESVKLSQVSEADGLNISEKVVSQLYKFTLEKYKGVDFGSIPNSKGNITELDDYKNILAGIELLRSLEAQSKEGPIEQIDILELGLRNLEKYQREFTLAYKMNKSLPIMIYEVTTMAVIRSLSYMMGNAITYVKDPTINSFKSLFDGKEEDILIRNLKKFNMSVQSGELSKLFDILLARKKITGATLSIIGIILGILIFIVPALRELVYFYYNSKVSTKEFLKLQAETLKNNIYTLKYRDKVVDKKVIKKQEEVVEKLNNMANKLTIDGEVSSKKTDLMIKNEKIISSNIDSSPEDGHDLGLL